MKDEQLLEKFMRELDKDAGGKSFRELCRTIGARPGPFGRYLRKTFGMDGETIAGVFQKGIPVSMMQYAGLVYCLLNIICVSLQGCVRSMHI